MMGLPTLGIHTREDQRQFVAIATALERERSLRARSGRGCETSGVHERPRVVECGDCGNLFEVSARNERAHRKRGTTPTCQRCRSVTSAPRATEAMRKWWLDRYSPDEIREITDAIWPTSD